MQLSKAVNILLLTTLTIGILVIGKQLILPFVMALMIWFLIKEIRVGLQRIPFIKHRFPLWLQNTLASLSMFLMLAMIGSILRSNIETLALVMPQYEANIEQMLLYINTTFNTDVWGLGQDFIGDFDFSGLVSNLLSSVTELLSNTFLVIIYILFLLLEESMFSQKIRAIYEDSGRYEYVSATLNKINKSMSSYFTLKTVVSLLTGGLSYLALLLIGIEAAAFWAFLIFLLNYIPNVGSLIATSFPALFALLQFGDFQMPIIVLVVVGAIQLVVGNVIEPRVLGNSLNVSALVVLVSLSFWGVVWGIPGMILSVPITVMLVILFAEFPGTRSVAIMLSEKGELNP